MLIEKIVEGVKLWKRGGHQITHDEIKALERIKQKGFLVEAVPSYRDRPSFEDVVNLFIPLHSIKKPISFEIWKDNQSASFFFYAQKPGIIEKIKSQVYAAYPNAQFVKPQKSFIAIAPDTYVSSAVVQLENCYCMVKCGFEKDPMTYIIESMRTNAMIQLIFKRKKISKRLLRRLEKKLSHQRYLNVRDEVLFKLRALCFSVLIRISAFSKNPYQARETVESITSAFSIFNGSFATFKPKIVSFPVISGSLTIFRKIVKRSFPRFFDLFGETFVLSTEELATVIHLPISIESPKVKYSFMGELPAS